MRQLLATKNNIVLFIKKEEDNNFNKLADLKYCLFKVLKVSDTISTIKILKYKINKAYYPENFVDNIIQTKEFDCVSNELEKDKTYELGTITLNADVYLSCNVMEQVKTGAEIKYYFYQIVTCKEV
jgi:predicted RND superfamily exporter protein